MDIKNAAQYAIKNRSNIDVSQNCGCYHCLSIFPKEELIDWTDQHQTAICPHCHVDSVLPDSLVCNLTKEYLKEVQTYWFGDK